MAGAGSNSSNWKLDSSITTLSPAHAVEAIDQRRANVAADMDAVAGSLQDQPDQGRRRGLAGGAGNADDRHRAVLQGQQGIVADRNAPSAGLLDDRDRRRDATAQAKQAGIVQYRERMIAKGETQGACRQAMGSRVGFQLGTGAGQTLGRTQVAERHACAAIHEVAGQGEPLPPSPGSRRVRAYAPPLPAPAANLMAMCRPAIIEIDVDP